MNTAITNEATARSAADTTLTNNLASESSSRAAGDAALTAQLDGVSFELRDVRRDSRSGSAAALAAAGLPQVMDAGRSLIAIGAGTYRGRSAFAVGGSYRVPNGSTVLKVGVTYDSGSHVGANAGVGFQF